MSVTLLTRSQQKVYDCLLQKSDKIVTRDEIAQSIWGNRWLEKYSDWQIDRLIYLLRHNLPTEFDIKTIRNSGYILHKKGIPIPRIKNIKEVPGILPTEQYLEFMNNTANDRKILKDLFAALNVKISAKKVLIINSYSFDNVNAAEEYFGEGTEIYFSNIDQRALNMHQFQIEKLELKNIHTIFDDIRSSCFKNNYFDVVINDFRLNFNTNDKQNFQSMQEIFRVLKRNGSVLISVVVDARYESPRFGLNQEKAPTNKDKPWTFMAKEGLERKCFTVPYYKKLFKNSGFRLVREFDLEEGKNWHLRIGGYANFHQPTYRRFLLKKSDINQEP